MSFSLSYDGNGSDGGSVPSPSFGDNTNPVTVAGNTGNLTRTHGIWLGWGGDPNDTVQLTGGESLPLNSNITLYAVWGDAYTVTYNSAGGTSVNGSPFSVGVGLDHTVQAAPTKNGYTFNGWLNNLDSQIYNPNDTFGSSQSYDFNTEVTLTAQWTQGSYTVIYDSAGGIAVPGSPFTVPGGTNHIVKFTSKLGYSFDGWLNNQDTQLYQYNDTVGSSYPVNTTVTLTAQWTYVGTYTVTYNSAGGSAVSGSPFTVTVGHIHKLQTAPTRSGYTFNKWLNSQDSQLYIANASIGSYSSGTNVTITAQWIQDTYTVTYNSNGGSAISGSPFTVNVGSTHTIQAAPTRSGYSFNGWLNSRNSQIVNPGSTVGSYAKNITATLTAQWTFVGTYSVAYDSNGGSAVTGTPFTITVGSTHAIQADPTKSGYTFNGWLNSQDSQSYSYGSSVGSYSSGTSVTLTAQWVASGNGGGVITPPGGGGGSGDPYMTTVSGTSYKLPTMNGAIRMYQGEVDGKTLTVNATLRTMSSTELQTQNLRSAIELSKTMSPKKVATFMKSICEKEETLCFFENFYIQHGEKVLAMNVWDQKFKVLHYTGGFETAALKNGDAALAASGVYTKYSGNTIKVTVAKGAEVFLSCYNSPLVRSGIYVDVPNMAEGNGASVNVLSAADMTLSSLDSVVAVPRRDAKALRVKREMFADHDGTRIRNVVVTL
jgi:uncharacterized repeat protein (TIGR02543 family)